MLPASPPAAVQAATAAWSRQQRFQPCSFTARPLDLPLVLLCPEWIYPSASKNPL